MRCFLLLKRRCFDIKMLISVILSVALMIYPVINDFINIYLGKYDIIPECMYFIDISQTSGVFPLFAPIIAVLPSVSIFVDDYRSFYIRSLVMRTGKRRYLLVNYIVCVVSGGAALLISELISFSICAIFSINSNIEVINPSALSSIALYKMYDEFGIIITVLVLLLLGFIFGMIWSGVGITVSLFIKNSLAAYSIPFLLYFTLSMILSISEYTLKFSPINFLYPSLASMPSITFCLCTELVLFLTISLCYWFVGRKTIDAL